MHKLKYILYTYPELLFLLISSLIVSSVIITVETKQARYEKYLEEQLKLERIAAGYYHTVVDTEDVQILKAQLLDVDSKLVESISSIEQLNYISVYIINDTIYYEFTYDCINKNNFPYSEPDLRTFFIYLDELILDLWKDIEPNVKVSVGLLNEDNYEDVLLVSENVEIVYSFTDKPEKEGTTQDWIDWFYYEKGYIPTDKELKEFKTRKNKELLNNSI